MPELLRAGKLAVEKGQAPGRDESYVKQLADYIIPPLVEAMHKVVFPVLIICMNDRGSTCCALFLLLLPAFKESTLLITEVFSFFHRDDYEGFQLQSLICRCIQAFWNCSGVCFQTWWMGSPHEGRCGTPGVSTSCYWSFLFFPF